MSEHRARGRVGRAPAGPLGDGVLLLDEVLAGGDASFQRRCMSKMGDLGASGRTVLVVSHDLAAVTRLCQRAILLDGGRVVRDGSVTDVVREYLCSDLGTTTARTWQVEHAPTDGIVRLRAVEVRLPAAAAQGTVDARHDVGVCIDYEVLEPGHALVPNIHVADGEGRALFTAVDTDPTWRRRPRPRGRYRTTAWIPGNLLNEGTVIVGAAISTLDPIRVHVFERDAVAFQVVDALDGASARGDYVGRLPGAVRPLLRWMTLADDDPAVAVETA